MTRVQWKKLSDEEKRLKVAELMGWTHMYSEERKLLLMYPPKGYRGQGSVPPEYINDLNAMHEVETMMFNRYDGEELMERYEDNLLRSVDNDITNRNCWHISATAAVRAEAFVLTMEGKDAKES